ncbi:PRTRC system protein F [Cupriavidus sp. WS]|uniref:PRTRC system protein F n=1 Tax=Cupriavidus sp. WS TaxID=1312922 RepID=UPI0009DC0D87|nr:PRTRC system protein F [Cupriavidus sp. WS]
MLFDPRPVDAELAIQGEEWSSNRHPDRAERCAAHAVLTLPSLKASVPSSGTVVFPQDADYSALARLHFECGPLRAADVKDARNAGDAFAQALFAWFKRRMPHCQRMTFNVDLFDRSSACDSLSYRDEVDVFTDDLYLAIELPENSYFAIGTTRAEALRATHKDLLPTAMSVIDEAAGKTLYLRTPDELLDMYARWWWEYDPTADDETAREYLECHYEGDTETIARHLPSAVRASMAPDDVLPWWLRQKRAKRWRPMSDTALRIVAAKTKGDVRKLCIAILDLRVAMRGTPKGPLIEGIWADPAYSAATILYTRDDDYVGELLDDHYEMASQSGEFTAYQAYVPIAGTPKAIQSQFRQWSQALEVIGRLDHLLTLISD